MLKVAVTGGAATGKSLVCECFGRLGAHVLNLDILAREAVKAGSRVYEAIVNYFGRDIVTPDGSLNRRKLRAIIVRDPTARKTLEELTHPEIFRLFEKRVAALRAKNEGSVVVAEVPLLVEVGLEDQFEVVVLVCADSDSQRKRLVARDGISTREAEALLNIQMPSESKRPFADHIIDNSGSVEDVEAAVEEIYKGITSSR